METNNETPQCLMANNYYQKKVNLDPGRFKPNLEKGVKRKPQIIVDCDRSSDKCQIGNIAYDELEEFHDRYWNCPGTINKRIFMATYLAVDPTDNNSKNNINIICYFPRNDGTMDIICQKSFASVLGVSKNKVVEIGHAKLLNAEFLYKEKRGGNHWKSRYDGKNDNGINYSNENSQNHSNSINDNDSTMGSNLSENGGINMVRKRSCLSTNEGNGESNKSYSEFNSKIRLQQKNKNKTSADEDDNAIFEPQIKNEAEESYAINYDEDDNGQNNMFQPVVEITEVRSQGNLRSSENNVSRPPRDYRNSETLPPHMIRKQSVYESAEERSAARQKARAILENLHSQVTITRIKKPPQFNQPYNHPNQMNRFNQPGYSNWHNRNFTPNVTVNRNFPETFLGPENWQRTLERNVRRRQRMQEVKIDCNHNLTRFCKVISVPHEDLVNFHNMYWNCQGIVEERIFLAKFMVVTPCNHRREMAIATRIPTSDGQLVEVCQKSFLSVVGITKHKVQAAARAKLKGTLYRKDGRGGFQKPKSHDEESTEISPNMQISNVMGRYENKESLSRGFNQNETIEIDDSSEDEKDNRHNENMSSKNISYEDSQFGNGDEYEENDSEMISAEDAFASGKLNYNEFRENIERNRTNEMHRIQLTRIKNELNLYKRRTRKLMLDRKNYLVKLTKFRMENIKLKKQETNLKQKSNNINLQNDLTKVNEPIRDSKIYDGHQNDNEKTDSIEISNNLNFNTNNEQSKDEKFVNEPNSIKNELNFTSNCNDNIINNISENNQNFNSISSHIEKISRQIEQFSNENS